jgi:hypothetical protein
MREFKQLFLDHACVKQLGLEQPSTPCGVDVTDGGLTPKGGCSAKAASVCLPDAVTDDL